MGILYHSKIGLAHISYTHDPAGQTNIGKLVFIFSIELFPDRIGIGVDGIQRGRIGLDTHHDEFGEFFPAQCFLFG